jgi:hypothetical protein
MRACISMLMIQLFLGAGVKAHGEKPVKPAKFYGHVLTDLDSFKLFAYVSPAFTLEGTANVTRIYFSVDEKGNFSFTLPTVEYPARIYMYESESGASICNYFLVEKSDSVFIKISLENDNPQVTFSGKGAAKYNCSGEVDRVMQPMRFAGSVSAQTADSILTVASAVLAKYKRSVDPQIATIINTDVTGEVKKTQLFSSIGFEAMHNLSIGKLTTGDSAFIRAKSVFIRMSETDQRGNNQGKFYSPAYISYLYERVKLKTIFHHGGKLRFESLYKGIKQTYKGLLRESLLLYMLQNGMDAALLFSGTDPDVYRKCVMDAEKLCAQKSIKRLIDGIRKSKVKGAKMFNIRLPADSSGRIVQLADFAGKVILIDLWPYACTGCSKFSQVFHQTVFPLFASNPYFEVVSIMLADSIAIAYEKYLDRLRSEVEPLFPSLSIYTYPQYVNLFASLGVQSVKDLTAHYNIISYPFVLLIGKDGKVFSSTLPFFTEPTETEKINQMIELIQQALKES